MDNYDHLPTNITVPIFVGWPTTWTWHRLPTVIKATAAFSSSSFCERASFSLVMFSSLKRPIFMFFLKFRNESKEKKKSQMKLKTLEY